MKSVMLTCSPMVTSIVQGELEHVAIAVRPNAEGVVVLFRTVEVVCT